MTARTEVVAVARTYIGVPWRHQGRSRETGVDCGGLIVLVCRELGITEYDAVGYARRPTALNFLGYLTAAGFRRLPIAQAAPGDLMAFREDRLPCHVAVLAERDGIQTMIHGQASRRAVVEEPLDHEWTERRIAAFRMVEDA